MSISSLRRSGSLATGMAILTAALPAGASASSNAVCHVNTPTARCVGSIGDRAVSMAPGYGTLRVRHSHAQMVLHINPLVSIFTQGITVTARLHVVRVPQGLVLTGVGSGDGERLAISGLATASGRSFTVGLAKAAG